jgi:hypothetical protein
LLDKRGADMTNKNVYITPIGQMIPVLDNSHLLFSDRCCKENRKIEVDAFLAWDKGIPDEHLAVKEGKLIVI